MRLLLLVTTFLGVFQTFAQPLNQKEVLTLQDTLRGSLGPGRTWWDATHYDLSVKFYFDERRIEGNNIISFNVIQKQSRPVMQIDLQEPLVIDSAFLQDSENHLVSGSNNRNNSLPIKNIKKNGNAWFLEMPTELVAAHYQLKVFYHGIPKVAARPPWDGGLIWRKDKSGTPWISIACQGLGASVWYPCKDHQSDEPDSACMNITTPETLSVVGNGRLRRVSEASPGWKTWTWAVTQPINNYNLIPYIGNYVSWKEVYQGEKGPLDCTYWVLKEDEAKAREQFKQVTPMLQCFENWFGPYPFYEDGYQLVQSPHLGMEHQSAVAYGNGFVNGYRGSDLSRSGWGLKWDFIIIHESGHEWFGNNITSKDIADMWIHESFTNYSETIYTGWQSGVEAGNDYVIGTRAGIRNDIPIIGIYGVNKEGSGDMYPKGGNMIHTIRTVINDDTLFKSIMRGMNAAFYHKTVTAEELFSYWSAKSGKDLTKIFDQYLRSVDIPELQYEWRKDGLYYRWVNCIKGFDMPVRGELNGKAITLTPIDGWKKHKGDAKEGDLKINRNYYINIKKV